MLRPRSTNAIPRNFILHGATHLPCIRVDCYSLELQDGEGLAGDRVNKGGFTRVLESLRASVRAAGEDPLGRRPSRELSRNKLDSLLRDGEAKQAALVHGAVEAFAQELKGVIARFLRHRSWRGTESLVVGGGFRDSRIGALAIARAGMLLGDDGFDIDVRPLEGDPDEAALIGAVHLLPAWMLRDKDAMLAADIGGTGFRTGIVQLNGRKVKGLRDPKVLDLQRWIHAKEKRMTRGRAVEQLAQMLATHLRDAEERDLALVPVIGVGCPGIIRGDGTIARGTQNLPGDWTSPTFHLPQEIRKHLAEVSRRDLEVIMHNDAVVQGLSQLPRMRKRRRWGIFTIGTGLGNARFTRSSQSAAPSRG